MEYSKAIPVLAGFAAAATVFMVAPGRADKTLKAPFVGRNFAHRGLHPADGRTPENSLAAFTAAERSGYGIELDVRLTLDGQVVVFHDDDLKRMTGAGGEVRKKTYDEVRRLRLSGTGEKIPFLEDVFAAIGRETLVIVDIKTGPRRGMLCKKTLSLIDSFGGPVCIESFDPLIVRWFRKNAPDILRGQLSAGVEAFRGKTGLLRAAAVSGLLTNFLARPHFIAYKIGKKPATVRLCEAMGAMRVAWTAHNKEAEKSNDAVIFEYYRPAARFGGKELSTKF